MKTKNSPRPNLFISRTKLLRVGVFIAFAAIVIFPLFTVSSASLSQRVSPNNDLNRAANSVGSANSSVSQRHEAVKSLNPADFGLASAAGVPSLAFLVQQGGESLATYDGTACTAPKQSFVVGETVCAKVTNISPLSRRIYWIDPDGHVVQADNVSSTNPSGTRMVNTAGNWKVYLVDSDGALRQAYPFTVSNPAQPEVDLSIIKYIANAGSSVPAGGLINYRITVKNNGPDAAVEAQLTESTPNNTELESSSQDSGPTFTCNGNSCTIPLLAAGASASFSFNYRVNSATPNGTVITNTATISSQTVEAYPADNSWTASATVSGTTGGGGETCTVACPEDIVEQANTTQNGESGRIVHFDYPSGNEECGTITVDHCNDCFFPVGTTVVTATASTGDTCTFSVTITAASEPGAPTISCPANKTANADSSCQATVDLGTPTTTGDNVTVTATRSDGRDINEPYRAGTTTVTWTATNSSGSASCEQTVTVNDVTAPTMDTPPSQTASADENCLAQVPDFTVAANVQDNCGAEVTQEPAAGTEVGLGTHSVTLTATDDAGNSTTTTTTFTVSDTTAPTVTAPADSSADADANCQAPVPNYAANSTAADNCDTSVTVTQSPAAGTMVGAGPHTVTVTATDDAGNSGTDTVVFTVNDNTAPTVTAPADSSAAADANCQAPVPNYAANSTAADNCDTSVTVTQSPAAGTMVGAGPHTVTVTATDDAGNSGTDTVVFTVNDTTPPVISCPANITQPADPGSCSATVNPGTATATDNCGPVTVTGSRSDGQPLNAPYPAGTTTITWTATDASGNQSSCTQTVTVNAPAATALGPANIWVGVKNSDDVGTRFDFLAEVYKNGQLIGSGQLDDQSSGSSAFNNAILRTIAIAQSQPASFCPGDQLSIKLSVRAGPTGHVSGTARLWYNDAAANSRFNATIDGNTNTYYLWNGFVLGNAPGPGPKNTVDVLVNRNQNGNAFKPFGTWVKTF